MLPELTKVIQKAIGLPFKNSTCENDPVSSHASVEHHVSKVLLFAVGGTRLFVTAVVPANMHPASTSEGVGISQVSLEQSQDYDG